MNYVLEVSWGCPNDKYPMNGLFQFDQAKALRDSGLEIVFCALDMRSVRRWRKWGINRFDKEGIPVFEYNSPCGPMKPAIKYRMQDAAFKRVIRAIESEFGRPAVLHIHTCQQAISCTGYCARNNIPYVITEHITPLDEGAVTEARKKEALSGARHVISVSNALGRDMHETYGVDPVTVPNIVDLSEFEYDQESLGNAGHSPVRFLSAASMNHGKGFDILVRAYAKLWKNHPDIRLTIMGDGPEMSAIRSMAGELGIPEVPHDSDEAGISFAGSYIRREFASELSRSDIFVLPSRSETFGLVYAEALAAGVPVIATACGGPEDFIDDTNGMLVPVDDVDALSSAMENMLETFDSYDRRSVSDACKRRFSPAAVAERLKAYLV